MVFASSLFSPSPPIFWTFSSLAPIGSLLKCSGLSLQQLCSLVLAPSLCSIVCALCGHHCSRGGATALALMFLCLVLATLLPAAAHWCTWLQGFHTDAPLPSQVHFGSPPLSPDSAGCGIALMSLWVLLSLCSISPLIVIGANLGTPTITMMNQALSHKYNDTYIKPQTGGGTTYSLSLLPHL